VRRVSPPPRSPYGRAVARLARRDHTEVEIRRALLRDGFSEQEIDSTLQRLVIERALDDRGFASRYARSRMRYQRLGRNRIRQELRKKGVAGAHVETGVAEALQEVSETEAIDTLARRWWRQRAEAGRDRPETRLRRLWAFLIRRGFPSETVQARLRVLWPRLADGLDGLEPAEEEGPGG
jgi:regulatory protein